MAVGVFFMSTRSGQVDPLEGFDRGWRAGAGDHQLSQYPAISSDGQLISYFYVDAQANDQPKLSIIPFEGGEPVKTINLTRTAASSANGQYVFAWMADGRSIAYVDSGGGIPNIWTQPIDGSAPKQLTNFRSQSVNAFAFSRDGKQIAVTRVTVVNEIVLIKMVR